jgi:hypothetical protein
VGKTIVLVGHCGPDASMLRTAVTRAIPGAAIILANDSTSLAPWLTSAHLLLVNRVLDGEFDNTTSGIELIRRIGRQPEAPPVMLISNLPEAQAEAVDAGARPGFGKQSLYADSTAAMLRDAAG